MNILFLTLSDINDINQSGIYSDLMREFVHNGHKVTIISPIERCKRKKSYVIRQDSCYIVKPRIGNVQKTSALEKAISTITLEPIILHSIKKYRADVKFDLIIYSTPPITFYRTIRYIKQRDQAKTYLLLKDIFPQNAVDLGMIRASGLIHRYFRKKEKRLYQLSDRIGCMSQANVDYVLRHNPSIPPERVEVSPNSIDPRDTFVSEHDRLAIRNRYGIPPDKTVFVYGGNLGKPQGIDFIIDCLRSQRDNKDAFFVIVGSGTEHHKLEKYVETEKPAHVLLKFLLPRDEYGTLIASCDVGMIFLDHRFTTPNFPSRLLAYMEAGLPVLACTDPNTDVGKVVTEGGFGWWCESNSVEEFVQTVKAILSIRTLRSIGKAGWKYLEEHYTVKEQYLQIIKSLG